MSFSRGLHTGWLRGIDNQQLVHARFGKKRGVYLGRVRRVRGDRVFVDLEVAGQGGRRGGVRRRAARRAGTGRARLHGGIRRRGRDDVNFFAQRGRHRPRAGETRRTRLENE